MLCIIEWIAFCIDIFEDCSTSLISKVSPREYIAERAAPVWMLEKTAKKKPTNRPERFH